MDERQGEQRAETKELVEQAMAAVQQKREQGWTQEDFAKALKHMLTAEAEEAMPPAEQDTAIAPEIAPHTNTPARDLLRLPEFTHLRCAVLGILWSQPRSGAVARQMISELTGSEYNQTGFRQLLDRMVEDGLICARLPAGVSATAYPGNSLMLVREYGLLPQGRQIFQQVREFYSGLLRWAEPEYSQQSPISDNQQETAGPCSKQ